MNEWMDKRKRKEVIDIKKKYGRRKEEVINKENEYKEQKLYKLKEKKPLKLLAIYSSVTLLLYSHRIKKS